jgi:hypothetical protein
MPRWITRRTLDGVGVAPPEHCYEPATIAAIPGVRTIEECVLQMLREDERIDGELDQPRISIKRGDEVIGYFEITRRQP